LPRPSPPSGTTPRRTGFFLDVQFLDLQVKDVNGLLALG
jgi:hypothetical protein